MTKVYLYCSDKDMVQLLGEHTIEKHEKMIDEGFEYNDMTKTYHRDGQLFFTIEKGE